MGNDFKNNDDILKYDPEKDSITSVGHMTQGRSFHAISVVEAADYTEWCDGSLSTTTGSSSGSSVATSTTGSSILLLRVRVD